MSQETALEQQLCRSLQPYVLRRVKAKLFDVASQSEFTPGLCQWVKDLSHLNYIPDQLCVRRLNHFAPSRCSSDAQTVGLCNRRGPWNPHKSNPRGVELEE